ncbi:putative Ankyrin repeat domain-containing protein [Daphnia magna]|uniref:Putative Ankyrin repeat domain-containing protein n=1 Tax=Daphnia magna TaxID=35525 RepID=A0A164HY05_9CRUS|nr:putative Ankyrin repeat domain-containing protein [Daphnia magna]
MFLEKNDIYVSCCCLTGRYMSYFHFNVLVSLFYFLFLNVMWLSNDDALTTTHSRPPLQYTGLHWAAKHGHDDLVKMLAGTHKSDVNARTVQNFT